MNLKTLWRNHATKLLGAGTALIGASLSAAAPIQALLSERGDLLYDLYANVANYLVFGAGLAIIKRGYTNTKNQP